MSVEKKGEEDGGGSGVRGSGKTLDQDQRNSETLGVGGASPGSPTSPVARCGDFCSPPFSPSFRISFVL